MGALSLDDRCQVFAEEIVAVTLLDAPALLDAFGRVRPRILGAPATPPEGDHGEAVDFRQRIRLLKLARALSDHGQETQAQDVRSRVARAWARPDGVD